MKRYFLFISFLLVSYCGKDPASPSTIDYFSDDQLFIEKLVSINNSIVDEDAITDRIIKKLVVSSDSQYYKIKELDLRSMGIDSIPKSIADLDSLSILNLNDNLIKYLPVEICEIINDNAVDFDVRHNHLCNSEVPVCILSSEETIPSFFDLQYSSEGVVCNYQMSVDDLDFIELFINANWLINNNDLEYDSIWAILNHPERTIWQDFVEPSDDSDGIENVVSRIIQIKYEGFNEESGGIHTIPTAIKTVDSLKFLYLSNNNLESIPGEIGDLERLEKLNLDGNKITEIPESIGGRPGLRRLKELIISNNELSSLTDFISQLSSLTELDLSRNNLATLPASLCDFVNIINVTYNKFCPRCTEECSVCNSGYNNCFNILYLDQDPLDAQNCDLDEDGDGYADCD